MKATIDIDGHLIREAVIEYLTGHGLAVGEIEFTWNDNEVEPVDCLAATATVVIEKK